MFLYLSRLISVTALVGALVLGSALLVHAESVVWVNNNIPDLIAIGSDGADRATVSMFNIGVTVQYRATPWLLDDGGTKTRPLQSGERLTVGDRVLFEFSPHVREDISWFGQGGAYDTPYGAWFDGIVPESATDSQLKPTLKYELISNDVAQGKYGTTESNRKGGDEANWVALSIAQPTKKVTVSGAGAQCASSANNGQVCTFTQAGQVEGRFEFASTLGEFFAAWVNSNKSSQLKYAPIAMTLRADVRKSAGDFDLAVPIQVLSVTFTIAELSDEVKENPAAHTPTTPALSTGGACIVGQPHTLSMVSTDPDGDSIRYGLDWNSDGSVDQWVPPTGYVASGTTQSASRTYSTAGQKTVSVLAQDEGGLSSSFATITFTCADSAEAGINEPGDNGEGDGDGPYLPPAATLDIRAIPSLVRQGNTTQVNWSAENVESCTVSGNNGDGWSGIESPIGGETSAPITGQTTYTLTCTEENGTTHAERATVNVIPGFEEV